MTMKMYRVVILMLDRYHITLESGNTPEEAAKKVGDRIIGPTDHQVEMMVTPLNRSFLYTVKSRLKVTSSGKRRVIDVSKKAF